MKALDKFNIISAARASKAYDKAVTCIDHNRFIADREAALKEQGLRIEEGVLCGSGGVKQVIIKKGLVLMQITAGIGEGNIADTVVLGEVIDGRFFEAE